MRHFWGSVIFVAAGEKAWGWLHRLGGLGLIALGLADNSVVPLPGSMDVLTILLAARERSWWWYYALMATIGSVLGGYITYRLARKGGKEALEKKLGKQKCEKAYRTFGKYGFGSIMVGAMSPPPVPIVPFLMTAGVMQYPRHKFLAALGSGRALRFTLVAWVGSVYGSQIIGWLGQYRRPALYVVITLAILGGLAGAALYVRRRNRKREQCDIPAPAEKAA